MLHEGQVVFALQSDFLENGDQNIALEHCLLKLDRVILFPVNELSEGRQEEIVQSTDLCDAGKVFESH